MVTLRTNGITRTEARTKLCSLPLNVLTMLLQLDGQHSYKFDGYPKDAKVIGARILDNPARIELVLYHPEFPINIGPPEYVNVTAKKVG